MKMLFIVIIFILTTSVSVFLYKANRTAVNYGAPPYVEDEEFPEQEETRLLPL